MSFSSRRQDRLQALFEENFKPVFIELENESHQHSVPEGAETHFKLLLVSSKFENLGKVQRQQAVYGLLKDEFQSGLHAFTQRLLTPLEWEKEKENLQFSSPKCHSK